ncbi:DoxX family membrane protein [Candidatus Dependentiae bacterium]|nr:DoxX family membrane protein [Candidatus Dependentiae bacterium]
MATTISNKAYAHLNHTWLMLKVTYSILFLAAGADKFFNMVTHWEKYLSPFVAQHLPAMPTYFLYVFGIIEIGIGIMIATKFTRLGAYLGACSIFLVVVDLLTTFTFLDIIVRDIVIIVGAIALAQLTTIKQDLE